MGKKMTVNISETHNAFFWSPQRTASNLAASVFDNYDFHYYDVSNGKVKLQEGVKHEHSSSFFDGSEEYSFILTCRNPYSQFVSLTGYKRNLHETSWDFLEILFQSQYYNDLMSNLLIRKPDYIIRTEYIYEDYLKIPFIKNSEFEKSGKLFELIKSKPNNSGILKNRKVKLTKELADMIYYNNIPIFDLIGYDKDSWKKEEY